MAVGQISMLLILSSIIICFKIIHARTEYTDFQIVGVFEETATEFETCLFKHDVVRTIQNQSVKFTARIVKGDSFFVHRKVCRPTKEGVAGIFVHSSPTLYAHISSICEKLEIPCFQAQWDEKNPINLLPRPESLYRAHRDLLDRLNWKYFLVIYDTAHELFLLQKTFNRTTLTKRRVRFEKLPPVKDDDYTSFLRDISQKYEVKNIVIACNLERTEKVLHQAPLVGMMNKEFTFFLTTLDFHVLDWEKIKYSGATIYSYQLVDPQIQGWKTAIRELINFKKCSSSEVLCKAGAGVTRKKTMTTQMAVFYDTIQIFEETIRNNVELQGVSLQADCETGATKQGDLNILDYMKNVEFKLKGFTGKIRLDSKGERDGISLNLIKLKEDGFQRIGVWRGTGDLYVSVKNEFNKLEKQSSSLEEGPKRLAGKTFHVTTLLIPPYTMIKDNYYEGYNILLLEELSKLLGFKYNIQVSKRYGMKDNKTGMWGGAIGQLINGKTDIVIADMNVLPERMEVVDFTIPIVDTGISILYTTLKPKPRNLLSFISPFSHGVWGIICLTFLGASITMLFITRVTPYEIVTSESSSTGPRNHYSVRNTIWFILSSLLQQGSDLSPKSFSLRMLTAFWWFFALVLVASYAANLATLSIIQDLDDDINSFDDLINQTEVKYGCIYGGHTWRFFRDYYTDVWRKMEFQNNTYEGIQAVKKRNGTYAFFMYSSHIDYHIARECGLRKVGEEINRFSFAIALQKDSPYLRYFNNALLKLQFNGTLEALRNKYWTNDSRVCSEPSSIIRERAPLEMERIGGIFILVLLGCAVALIFALIDAAWKSRFVKL